MNELDKEAMGEDVPEFLKRDQAKQEVKVPVKEDNSPPEEEKEPVA